MLKQDGELNKAGIEEICKVANWKPEGGATPTPVAPPARPTSAPVQAQELPAYDVNLDDEIPF